ncbi:hypothetical protein V0M98_37520 (plasmid) [Pseudomonas silesiensis]|uniref:hypothetical protein n=1 Tax=Pseudomonas silesiensis TaxID=1853130 RepID=UPI0030CB0BB5
MKLSDLICPSFVAGAMVSLAITASAYVFIFTPHTYVERAYQLGQVDVGVDLLMDKGKVRPKEYWLQVLAGKGNVVATTIAMGNVTALELEALGATKDTIIGLLADKVTYAESDKILLQSMEVMTDLNLLKFLDSHKVKFVPSEKERLKNELAAQASGELTWRNYKIGTRLSEVDQARLADCLEKLESDWPRWKEALHPEAKGLCATPVATPVLAP